MAQTNTTNNTGRKTTNIISQKRIEEIAQRLLEFWPRWKICSHYSELWSLSDRSVDEMIAKAQAMIRSSTDNFDEMLKDRIAQGMSLLSECIKKGDLKTAATYYTALNKIGGLEKTSIDHTSGGVPLISFSFAPTVPQALPESTIEAQAVEIQVISQDLCSPNETAKVIKAPELLKNEPPDDHPDAS